MAHSQTNHPSSGASDHYGRILILIVVGLPCLWIYNHLDDIISFAYNNFVTIGLIVFGLIWIGILFIKSKLKTNLKKDRVSNLAKVWNCS
jgi:SNF family Na+-dependent transporter